MLQIYESMAFLQTIQLNSFFYQGLTSRSCLWL